MFNLMVSAWNPISKMYAPYAVVAVDSGVSSSSFSLIPHRAQNSKWFSVTSCKTPPTPRVAAVIAAKLVDFAAINLYHALTRLYADGFYQHYARVSPCIISEVVVILPTENNKFVHQNLYFNVLDEVYKTLPVQQSFPQFSHKRMFNVLFPHRSGGGYKGACQRELVAWAGSKEQF